jgi:hypothetical protein
MQSGESREENSGYKGYRKISESLEIYSYSKDVLQFPTKY